MNAHSLCLVAFFSLLVGCTHTTHVVLDQRDSSYIKAVSRIGEMTEESTADIVLADSEKVKAHHIMVGVDSTTWLVGDSAGVRSVATTDIMSVNQLHRLKGVGEGFQFGLIFGAALGGGIYYVGKRIDPTVGHPDLSGLVIPAFAILGSVLGMINGAVNGSHDEFIFEREK